MVDLEAKELKLELPTLTSRLTLGDAQLCRGLA